MKIRGYTVARLAGVFSMFMYFKTHGMLLLVKQETFHPSVHHHHALYHITFKETKGKKTQIIVRGVLEK